VNYSKIERNYAGTRENSIGTKPSYVEICDAVPAVMKLLETEQKSDRTLARYGATVERFAKIMGNYDAILISIAGIGIPTITQDPAMRDIVTAGGIATVGVGIVIDGIATEQGGSKLTRQLGQFLTCQQLAFLYSEADNRSASVVFSSTL